MTDSMGWLEQADIEITDLEIARKANPRTFKSKANTRAEKLITQLATLRRRCEAIVVR